MLLPALALACGCGEPYDPYDYGDPTNEPGGPPADPCVENEALGELLACRVRAPRFVTPASDAALEELVFLGDDININVWRPDMTPDASTVIVSRAEALWAAVEGHRVYWLTARDDHSTELHRHPVDPPYAEITTYTLEITGRVNRFAVADDIVYYPDDASAGVLHRLPLDGSAEPTASASQTIEHGQALELRGNELFWNGDDGLFKLNLETELVTELAPPGSVNADKLVFTSEHVFWFEDRSLYRVPLSGVAAPEQVFEAEYEPYAWTLDEQTAYLLRGRSLWRVELETGVSTTLVELDTPFSGNTDLVVDDEYLYWAPDQMLRRLRKPS